MAAAGGWGGPKEEPPVQYHMSDDEEDKAFYARAGEPRSPTSPVGGPAVADAEAAGLDDDMDAAGYSSAAESDEAAWSNFEYEDEPPDPVAAQRQSNEFAEYALHHYNADPNNRVKYELVEATLSTYIFVGYGHVNFVARPCGGGKERFFFAEVHQQLERDTMIPTCLHSLDSEDDRVGGLEDEPVSISQWDEVGAHYCFACSDALKHPKDGTCYKAGHYEKLPWTKDS
ncbi:uncharacterized protein LOC133920634 [Phragmites australis]|uniref:uncharacterized protein LOC133920634 n=1 Tax=Phragmites australis TaxID=29695 RepID=UPI002D796B5F|nr:uncharacterized protein LOC133920634 [Phragmites australis]